MFSLQRVYQYLYFSPIMFLIISPTDVGAKAYFIPKIVFLSVYFAETCAGVKIMVFGFNIYRYKGHFSLALL